MAKPLLIAGILAVIGAAVIHFTGLLSSAALAFALGAVVTALVYQFTSSTDVAEQNSMTLYVGNLPYRVHEGEVKALFASYGSVQSVRLVRDRKTGRRKGFGFVEMNEDGAKKAMSKLNDFIFQERTLKVREAKSQDSDSK
ncbi:RNA recognition motif domain-containing protein [Paraferrimonas sedimenticola]|uniref:RNA-binding protein n=1 Tax=Paraferrimonas sedimenticola TaxID=375674 RepID=A0AA37RU44_9GAMM|nr:RNA-binding protein [Paraferrimonas sedimenticola]GLP95241.1 RNA-binding protein [Paraferrimonas sedimenticola]